MREIPLSRSRFAFVDDEDFPILSLSRWRYRGPARGGDGYVIRSVEGSTRKEYLHRVVMAPIPRGHEVIFMNGDHMDCRKSNLRVVTVAQARRHHRCRRDSAGAYKGVWWQGGAWYASIRVDGVVHYLGRFERQAQAARAYDAAALRLHGVLAVLNFPTLLPAAAVGHDPSTA